jgi:murein L,D-transpeptidase YafK
MLNQGPAFSGGPLQTLPLGDNDPVMMARGLPAGRGSLRLHRSPLARALLASAALSAAVLLSGCYTDNGILPMSERAARPLPDKLVKDIESKGMDRESPILLRAFKEESELEVWKQDRSGRYALLKTYPICRWSGELGPKIREGDRQAPEGFYHISPGQMNPNSQYYLSFDLGYPNAFDRAHGRTGAQLMVHGDCSSRGCYSMTDEQISEIYALGRDAFFGGQKSFQVQAYPFRMTPQNLARHRNNPHMAFWKMLKKGNDHFEVSGIEPKVDVCEKRYVFDAVPPPGSRGPLSFRASEKCPAYGIPEDIADLVREKQHNDEVQTAELIRRGSPSAPVRTNADGGMHAVFVSAVKRNQIGVAPSDSLFSTTAPGTIPPTVRPPRLPELADAPIMDGIGPPPKPAGAKPEPAAKLAIAEPEPAKSSGPGGLFGSLFSFGSAEAKDEKKEEKKKDEKKESRPLLNRMATMVGLGKSDAASAESKSKPPRVAHGAIKPKPSDAKPTDAKPTDAKPTEAKTAETKPAEPARKPAQEAAAAPAPATTAMSGAAPVMPAGGFDSRWGGLR